jgi:cell division protein FtsQ
MSQTIKRKAKGVRRAAAAQGAKQKVSKAKATSGSAIDAAMRWLPFTEEQLHRFFLAVILAAALGLAWTIASLAGAPALIDAETARIAANAGFEVRRVEVRGVKRMNELKVYERVLGERDRAMPQVDLPSLRNELLELSWVEDARVSRQLPDTLVVDIVERKPHAVLRKPGRLVLIDAEGHELEPVSAARAKGMLVISGPGAGPQAPALSRLLESAPALKSRVTEAEWMGNRRWNLTFDTGQVLALPQGEKEGATALISFARLDGVNRMLGGKVAIFDMRAPDRIYLRVPGRSGEEASRIAAAKAAAQAAKQETE